MWNSIYLLALDWHQGLTWIFYISLALFRELCNFVIEYFTKISNQISTNSNSLLFSRRNSGKSILLLNFRMKGWKKPTLASCGYFKKCNAFNNLLFGLTIIKSTVARGREVPKNHTNEQLQNIKHQTLTQPALLIRFILHMSLISPWECASRRHRQRQPSMLLNACTRTQFIRFVSHINKHSYFFFLCRLQMKMWLAPNGVACAGE